MLGILLSFGWHDSFGIMIEGTICQKTGATIWKHSSFHHMTILMPDDNHVSRNMNVGERKEGLQLEET
jgi:hypothetical protein